MDLFQRALELATTDREDQVYIEGEKDFSTPYDWVGNKVLSSTVCYGSLAHIQAIIDNLADGLLVVDDAGRVGMKAGVCISPVLVSRHSA